MPQMINPPFPKDTWVRQSLDNLRDDITESELVRIKQGFSSKIVKVTDPGYGLFSSEPRDGLIDIVYQCDDRKPRKYDGWESTPCAGFRNGEHTHGALYGPSIIQWADNCRVCNLTKYRRHEDHAYEPIGIEIVNWEHFELYAD